MDVTTSSLINATTTIANNPARRPPTIILAERHGHIDWVRLALIFMGSTVAIMGCIVAFFAVVALIWACIVRVNWKQLYGKLPTKPSEGIRDLELGLLQTEERIARPDVEAAQSGGQPFANENVMGSKD
ncbi:hypothetical protein F4680DRAFT_402401 [Xylaria scruposa]|nr:hypothetical protein F4680DRAFT_402401 [Xylaria scruposa]